MIVKLHLFANGQHHYHQVARQPQLAAFPFEREQEAKPNVVSNLFAILYCFYQQLLTPFALSLKCVAYCPEGAVKKSRLRPPAFPCADINAPKKSCAIPLDFT